MTTFEVRGLDLSLFRDGRPFTADSGGGTIQSYTVPAPQTVAGFIRTQAGKKQNIAWSDPTAVAELRSLSIRGPLLLRDGEPVFPAPRDAALTLMQDGGVPKATWLQPASLPPGAYTNLPDGCDVLAIPQLGKPEPGYATWTGASVNAWLAAPGETVSVEGVTLPPQEERLHVSIDRATLTGEDGLLFGVTYTGWESRHAGDKVDFHRWSLGVAVTPGVALEPVGAFGGENRVAAIDAATGPHFQLPNLVATALHGARSVRLVLATPALFDNGWFAGWMNDGLVPGTSTRVKLRAAAVGRRQAITGWDYQLRQPKPVQLAAPAGSVYFLDIVDGSADDIAENAWLMSVASESAARLDGFGLALWGIWK